MLPELKIIIEAVTKPAVDAVGRLERRMGGLRRGTDQAGRRLKEFGDKAQQLGARMSVISGAVAIAASGAFLMAKNTADAADKIDKSSKAVGLSAEAYQELTFAIGQVSDVTDDQFDSAMRQMQTRMGQAADGSTEMVEAFEAIGISQQDIISGNVGTEQAFEAFIASTQKAATPAEAMAIAAKLMGEEAAKLGPILRESGGEIDALRARAQELDIVLSDDVIASGVKFAGQMDELNRQLGALKIQIGAAFLPVLTERLIPAIQDKVIPALQSFIQTVSDIADFFQGLPAPVQDAAAVIAATLGAAGPIILAIGVLSKVIAGLVAATGPIGLFIAAAALLTAAWFKWGDDIKAAVGQALEWIRAEFAAWLEWVATIPAQLVQIGSDIIQGLMDGIAAKWEELKAQIYSLTDMLPAWMKSALESRSPSKVFMRIGEDVGGGLALGIKQTIPEVEQAVQGMADAANAAAAQSIDVAAVFSNNILSEFDAIASGTKSVKEAFTDMVDGILADIGRIILQKNILGPLGDALSGIFGDSIGGLFGSSSSTVVTAPISSGGGGSSGTASSISGYGGSATSVVINNNASEAVEVSAAQNGNDLVVMVDRAVASAITSGGATYKAMRQTFGVRPGLTRRV